MIVFKLVLKFSAPNKKKGNNIFRLSTNNNTIQLYYITANAACWIDKVILQTYTLILQPNYIHNIQAMLKTKFH